MTTLDAATPGVAASLAVLAGIAASDVVCCAKLRKRARGQDHKDAVGLLRTVAPTAIVMAKDLARLLAAKDESHYGLTLVDRNKGRRMVAYVRGMIELGTSVIAG